jgi:hypothetical protein
VWLSDATADRDLLKRATGLEIVDATPAGRPKLSKQVLQYPIDITRGTALPRLKGLLRGVLASRPDCHRAGIITHSTLRSASKQLGTLFDDRVTMVEYFGSGEDRASNRWHRSECDLLIVAGTPRVGDMDIRKQLLRVGQADAINSGGGWGELCWQGFTVSGMERIVHGRGYQDAVWQQAHRSRVRAAIIQAAGRARALLDSGCDAVILSTEECGFTLADTGQDPEPVTDSEFTILETLTAVVPLIHVRDNRRYATTNEVAERCGRSPRQTRDILNRLANRGLVERIGERTGWEPIAD